MISYIIIVRVKALMLFPREIEPFKNFQFSNNPHYNMGNSFFIEDDYSGIYCDCLLNICIILYSLVKFCLK